MEIYREKREEKNSRGDRIYAREKSIGLKCVDESERKIENKLTENQQQVSKHRANV